ncbi:hypothetical protein B0H13DRAFT_2514357 [Mycena leptocephala]|nr:hypothetical protein B0H13DRAFT_2514357 [Mycena leptocephala]
MAGFLRKKKQDSVPAPSPIPAPSPPLNYTPHSPIFARFATTAVDSPALRVVSSPMALASGPRRDQAPNMTNGAPRGAVQQREDTRQPRQNGGPSYVQASPSDFTAASASIASAPSYASPSQNRFSSPPSRNQTLPTPVPPPVNPTNRRFSHVPPADKPLPSIQPQGNHPDPLGSMPPQSALPAHRRASARGHGFQPQPSVATQNLPNGRVMGAPAQQPPISSTGYASPRVGTRTLPPSSNQTPSARPDPSSASSHDPSRYPKEYARQDLRHKLSDASSASGLQSAIPAPVAASPPRHNGQWAPDDRAPLAAAASYQVNLFPTFYFFLLPCGYVWIP